MITPNRFDIQPLYPIDHSPFVRVVLYYLKEFGMTEFGGETYSSQIWREDVEASLSESGLSNNKFIDKFVVEEWIKQDKKEPLVTLTKFAYNFERIYHNIKIQKYTSIDTQKRNEKLKEEYQKLVVIIHKLQGYLDPILLRSRIESNYIHKPFVKETVYRCLTAFCNLSLNCDEQGNFSINCVVEANLRDLINELLASILERRISELVNGEFGAFVKTEICRSHCRTLLEMAMKNSQDCKGFKWDLPVFVIRNKFK